MSSDGEINVAVKAEGVDEAAAEMGGDGGGGGGGGGRSGTLKDALKGGFIGGLLSQALGPLLDALDPILKVLKAFLAPVAMLLMRLLTPVLRLLLPLLPVWMDFVDNLPGMIDDAISWIRSLPGKIWDFMQALPGKIWDAISAGASWFADGAANIGEAVWDFMEDLPGLIAQKLKESVPGGGGNILPGDGPGGLPTFSDIGASIGENFGSDGQSLNPVNIAISGGLEPFVSEVTRNNSIDWP